MQPFPRERVSHKEKGAKTQREPKREAPSNNERAGGENAKPKTPDPQRRKHELYMMRV